jgi:hypothetical protein
MKFTLWLVDTGYRTFGNVSMPKAHTPTECGLWRNVDLQYTVLSCLAVYARWTYLCYCFLFERHVGHTLLHTPQLGEITLKEANRQKFRRNRKAPRDRKNFTSTRKIPTPPPCPRLKSTKVFAPQTGDALGSVPKEVLCQRVASSFGHLMHVVLHLRIAKMMTIAP